MLTSLIRKASNRSCFNPRPALRPGDALEGRMRCKRGHRFNPRPALRPGDAQEIVLRLKASAEVSIRARP